MTDKTDTARPKAGIDAKKCARRLVLAVLAFSGLGFLLLPVVVKSLLVDQLATALRRPVALATVSINPYTLSLQFGGFSIQEKGGGETVAAFDSLTVDAEWSSLWQRGPVIRELTLVAPRVRFVRLADGVFNFSDLIDQLVAEPESDAPPARFAINNVRVLDGRIEFDDRMLGEEHVISELEIGLPFLSSLPEAVDDLVSPVLSASIDGSPLLVQGRGRPFHAAMASELTLQLSEAQLARYAAYLPHRLPIALVSATLDSELTLAFERQQEGGSTLVVGGVLGLKDVAVNDRGGAPLLSVGKLEVALAALDPLNGRYAIERIGVEQPELHARVSRQGTINWVDFLGQEMATSDAAQGDGRDASDAPPIEWSVDEVQVSGGALRWRDESHGEAFNARVDDLEFSLGKLDSKHGAATRFDLAFRLDAEQWLKVEAFSVKQGSVDLAGRQVSIGELAARNAQLLIRRARDGRVEFVPPPSLQAVEASQQNPSAPWKLTVAKYRGERLGLRFEDHGVSPAVTHTIDALSIEADALSTEPGTTASLSGRFSLNGTGSAEVSGSVTPLPLDADLKLAVNRLDLLPLQPYFAEHLNVDLQRGHLAVNGKLRLRLPAGATADAGQFAGGFSGQLAVSDFSAVDKSNSADFLNWASLSFARLDLSLNPDSLSIGELALADFFARVVISPEGKLNLLQVVRGPATPLGKPLAKTPASAAVEASGEGSAVAPVATGSPPRMPVKVGKITLQGGDIKFSDRFIKPNYSADLTRIGGAISGLSSDVDSVATIDLRGSYDDIAPLKISGQLNPLLATPYLDVQADVKGIEMTALSPYSSKYAGYAIDKGKMSLFVKYKIEKNQLTAANRVFLDQLTFGDAIDSPEATRLPVSLAVALLKNSKGEIDINLPIAGSLDDPEFSIGEVLGELVGNLLLKVVTSPFALLGSIFAGGEELSQIEFDAGLAEITPAAEQRLDALARALLDRPALRLDIEGRADAESDSEGLKRDRLNRKLQAVKAERGAPADATAATRVAQGSKEYGELLERAYRDEDFEKPRNVVGMVKSLPLEEMEKLMLANTVIDDEALRGLAERRAIAVRDWLLARSLPSERLFLRPVGIGKADAGSEPGQGGGKRVVFALH